jgi:SAM-dependent methyltransferase
MLDVARDAASRERLSIDWRSGRAEELPYDDEQFDLVLCQFALMFFSDRQAALSEMHRVLANDGRLALSVFQNIRLHPFYQTLDKAIERRLGTSGISDIFALGDAEALRSMLEEAGFREIVIESHSHTSLFPNPEGFLAGEIDVDTASIPAMQNLDANEREALTRALHDEMEEPLRSVTKNGHVEMPFHVQFAMARKSN